MRLNPRGAPPHDGENFGLPGTLKKQGGGPAQWSETHSDPPKNPKNCVTVPKITFTKSLTCFKMNFDNFRHFWLLMDA